LRAYHVPEFAARAIEHKKSIPRRIIRTQSKRLRQQRNDFGRDDWGIAHVYGHTDADAVFGVKDELVRDYPEHPPGVAPDGSKRDGVWATIEYDFVMAKLPEKAA
jgi:hypothetical protein